MLVLYGWCVRCGFLVCCGCLFLCLGLWTWYFVVLGFVYGSWVGVTDLGGFACGGDSVMVGFAGMI